MDMHKGGPLYMVLGAVTPLRPGSASKAHLRILGSWVHPPKTKILGPPLDTHVVYVGAHYQWSDVPLVGTCFVDGSTITSTIISYPIGRIFSASIWIIGCTFFGPFVNMVLLKVNIKRRAPFVHNTSLNENTNVAWAFLSFLISTNGHKINQTPQKYC